MLAKTNFVLLLVLLSIPAGPVAGAPPENPAHEPIRVHPDNPKYFLFRGKPLVLITATEHYGSVVNARFDFERYLTAAADKKQNYTRLFLLFRELQSARNPYSPLKPESPDYVTPYPRTGPGLALDGEPKYDLDQWNPVFFERLHQFLARASELGIIVEITLFSSAYNDPVWSLSPLRAENNINDLPQMKWSGYTTKRDPAMFRRQESYVRKIVRETNRYDNIFYELCNEAGVGSNDHAAPEEVDQWLSSVNRVIRDEMDGLGRRHLVSGIEAMGLWTSGHNQRLDNSFPDKDLDAITLHSISRSTYQGRHYHIGNFMSKQLVLAELRNLYLATYHEKKPLIMDEDNTASMYRDETGWTIHRKRAWTTLLSGVHYNYIDFSITVGNEAGTEESQQKIRTWMKHLSEFFNSLDFIGARPMTGRVRGVPDFVVESVFGTPRDEYVVYLADAREVTDPASGEPIKMSVTFTLPGGRYEARLYSPVAGSYSPAIWLDGEGDTELDLPPFQDDLVIHIRRAE